MAAFNFSESGTIWRLASGQQTPGLEPAHCPHSPMTVWSDRITSYPCIFDWKKSQGLSSEGTSWRELQENASSRDKGGLSFAKLCDSLLGVAKKLAGRHHHSQSIRRGKAMSQLKYKHWSSVGIQWDCYGRHPRFTIFGQHQPNTIGNNYLRDDDSLEWLCTDASISPSIPNDDPTISTSRKIEMMESNGPEVHANTTGVASRERVTPGSY